MSALETIIKSGSPLDKAEAAIVFLHGRGATAQDILSLAPSLGIERCAFLAPQAAGRSWYPQSFLAPRPDNQPFLDRGQDLLQGIVEELESWGFAASQIGLLGFSQGACMAAEFLASRRALGAAVIFTGGLIGPEIEESRYGVDLRGTKLAYFSSDPDPHVPPARARESFELLRALGAEGSLRIIEGIGHRVTPDMVTVAGDLFRSAFSAA